MLIQAYEAENYRIRTTIVLDDDLLAEAQDITGISEKSTVLKEALKSLIARESARRPILLGGTGPGAAAIPRRLSATG